MSKKKKVKSRRKKIRKVIEVECPEDLKEIAESGESEVIIRYKIPMIVYHGTSITNLDHILQNGLVPREIDNRDTNWKDAPSRTDMIYLSRTAFAIKYAWLATEEESANPIGVLFEIDTSTLDTDLNYPDEDFISQKDNIKDINQVRNNLEKHKERWFESLFAMGNICYKGIITPDLITRYCTMEFHKRADIFADLFVKTGLHYKDFVRGSDFFKELIEWLFGDREEIPHLTRLRKQFHDYKHKLNAEALTKLQENIEFWEEQDKDRTGITVVNLR